MLIFLSGLKGSGNKYVVENLFGLFMRMSSREDDLFWALFSCFDRGRVSGLGSEVVKWSSKFRLW